MQRPSTVFRRTASPAGSAASAALLGALIAALLLLQTLGVVHAIVHRSAAQTQLLRAATSGSTAAPSLAGAAAGATAVGSTAAPGDWADALFALHDKGGSVCALYDQLVQPPLPLDFSSHADAAFAPPLPAEPPRSGHVAPQAAGYLARGPPDARV